MSQVDDIKHFIQDCLRNQLRVLDWLETHGPSIIRALVPYHIGMVPIPPWARDEIADFFIERLLDAIAYARLVNALQQALVLYMGSPDALRAAADALGAAVTAKAADFSMTNLREDSLIAMSDPAQWSGPGSAQYAKSFDGQALAFSRISEYSGKMEDALKQMATNIEDFYIAVRDAALGLLEVIGGIVILIVTWESVIGGIAGIVVAIIGVVNIINSFTDLSNEQMLSTKEMLGDLNSDIEAWPTAKFGTP